MARLKTWQVRPPCQRSHATEARTHRSQQLLKLSVAEVLLR